MSYRWWSCCRTNTGRRRKVNEDAYLQMDHVGLWLIADGMGGHARGDVASRFVIEAFDGLPKPQSMDEFSQAVKSRLAQANQRIRDEVSRAGSDQIMGTTVVAFMAYKRDWQCIWAGDSRAYLLRDGRLTQISHDHSVAQEMVDRGELRPDQVASHPLANRITRAIGTQDYLQLDEYHSLLRDGDTILLCSDGLNKEVDEQEFVTILEAYDCKDASRELVDLTLERGARDNVTVAVIQFEATTGFGDEIPDTTEVNYDVRGRLSEAVGRIPSGNRLRAICSRVTRV